VLPRFDVRAARAYAERVRAAFSVPADPEMPRVTISAGVTAAVGPIDVEPLLQTADSALYAAKHDGRNRTIVEPPPEPSEAIPAAGLEPATRGI
jgi:PleD family two-component response regulator